MNTVQKHSGYDMVTLDLGVQIMNIWNKLVMVGWVVSVAASAAMGVAHAASGGGSWDFEGRTTPQVQGLIVEAVQAFSSEGYCDVQSLSDAIRPVAEQAREVLESKEAPLNSEEAHCLKVAIGE